MKIENVTMPISVRIKQFLDKQDLDNSVFTTTEIRDTMRLDCSTRSIIDVFLSYGLKRFKVNHITVYWGNERSILKFIKQTGGKN